MKYKRWTLEQKLEILSESEEIGIVESCRKYGVSTGTFYSWRKKFDHKGEAGLKVTYDTKSKELKEAEEDIDEPKNITEERRNTINDDAKDVELDAECVAAHYLVSQ